MNTDTSRGSINDFEQQDILAGLNGVEPFSSFSPSSDPDEAPGSADALPSAPAGGFSLADEIGKFEPFSYEQSAPVSAASDIPSIQPKAKEKGDPHNLERVEMLGKFALRNKEAARNEVLSNAELKARDEEWKDDPMHQTKYGVMLGQSYLGLDGVRDPYVTMKALGMKPGQYETKDEAWADVWKQYESHIGTKYDEREQKKAEFKRGLDEFGKNLETALPEAVLTGKPLSPDMMEKATRYGQAEKVMGVIRRASEAVELMRGMNRSSEHLIHEANVGAEADRIYKRDKGDGTHYRVMGMEFGKPKTREEAEQQARSELGESYEVPRSFISNLADILSGEDGKLDEGAVGAMMLALDSDATGQQTIDSKFFRNTVEALKRWVVESSDFVGRYSVASPAGGGITIPHWVTDREGEERRKKLYKDPRIEKLKSSLTKIENTRLTASDKAGYLTGALTELGTMTGDSTPALLAGLMSGGLAIAALAPATMNRQIADAYADGKKHPELYGLTTGGFTAVAEGSFGVAIGRVPMVGKLIDKAALKMIGLPAVGKAAAVMQGNVYMRFLGNRVIAESAGELGGEEVIAQTGSYLAIQTMRKLGVDMDVPEWHPFKTAWDNIQDARQTGATVAYCTALGLMGLRADIHAAKSFSLSRQNLMTVGLKSETATRLAVLTQDSMRKTADLQVVSGDQTVKQEEIDRHLQEEYRKAYESDVVNEDPVKLRDRLKKNNKLFMSDVEAQVALREGVLQVALREQGVLHVEESLAGKNVVTVEDTEQSKKDRSSWKEGNAPEGYETPTKQVELTDEQLSAYSQYAIGYEGLKRMKAIRSAALGLDMAQRVNEGEYAKTLPLTETAAPVAAELARSKGSMNIDVLQSLSAAAAREEESGRNLLPGVSNSAVMSLGENFIDRIRWEARNGNEAAASRMLAGEGGAAAIRLTANKGTASRILYNPGHTLSTNLAEDAVESMLVDKLKKEGGMDAVGALTNAGREWLGVMHRDMQSVRRQVIAATGKDIMHGLEKAEPSLMNVVEYFSHLSQSAFYQRAGQYGLNDAAMRHVQFMDSALMQAKYINDVGSGFSKWVDTEVGQAWQKEGGTLAGLLRETGHELANLYTSSRVTAENVAAVEEARRYMKSNGSRTTDDIRAELKDVEKENADLTPESEIKEQKPQDIQAEESVTGEDIPAEACEEVPNTDGETGELLQPVGSVIEIDMEGKGRGLDGGRYAEDGVEGSVIGMVPLSSIEFSELPYSGFASADGMAEVLRHPDGKMEVIMGGALLRQDEHSRTAKARVWDAEARNEAWVRRRVLEQMVLSGRASKVFSVRDYLEHYRDEHAAEPPNSTSMVRPGKKATHALAILEKASPQMVQDVLSGETSAADAYAAVETAATHEGQVFYVSQKEGDKKVSMEYLTAITRAYESAPTADSEVLKKQAKYVVAARKEIRKVISRLHDVRGDQPRVVAEKELGLSLPTTESVSEAIGRLELLDGSFDAFDSELDVPSRSSEWSGKVAANVVVDFLQAREEVKQMAKTEEAAKSLTIKDRGIKKQQEASAKLGDAGRKITAHKDNYSRGYSDSLSADLPEEGASATVSKYFPSPNYEKLINEGMSQDAVTALCLVRDSIPDKPRGWRARSSYMEKWLKSFQAARQISVDLMEGRISAQDVLDRLRNNDNYNRTAIYTELGYPLFLKAKGIVLYKGAAMNLDTHLMEEGWVLRHETSKTKSNLPGKLLFSRFDTMNEAIHALRLGLIVSEAQKPADGEKKAKAVKLDIGQYKRGERAGEVIIFKKLTGGVHVVLKGGFKSFPDAEIYRDEHLDELTSRLKRISLEPDIFPEVSTERVGEDYREGKNVDNAQFMETFGISGITYGNWVAGQERQAKLNATYDAFMDLANLLNVPPRVISLNGELGIQFGASGRKGSMAHYRHEDTSINLTRKMGSGSLAHEWFHSLDNYFMRKIGKKLEMTSMHLHSGVAGMNDQAGKAFVDLVKSIQSGDYERRSSRMPGKSGYWDSTVELMARAFQVYIVKKAEAAGITNEYMSNYTPEEAYDAKDEEYKDAISESRYPYPTTEEMKEFSPKFDAFFESLTHVRQADGNYVTFSVTAQEENGNILPASTFSVTAMDVNGTVLKPDVFVSRPDGSPDWFVIPRRKGQAAMPVRLLVGEDEGFHRGGGLTHIAASRDLDGLWEKTTPEKYLTGVLSKVGEIYVTSGSEVLVRGKNPSSWVVLTLEKNEGYYSIKTAYPVSGSKKPRGEKISLAERVAGNNQTRVDRSQRPANPDAIPDTFGTLENKIASLGSSAGGGLVFSLPRGAELVNIDDVRLSFDDGRQMHAGAPVSTMSLALMDDRLNTAAHLKEKVVQQLIRDVRAAVGRLNRIFSGKTSVETATKEVGQAQALLGMINKYANKGYRPRLEAQMRYVEVYARMLESGKITSFGSLKKSELADLKEELEAELFDAVNVSALGDSWETASGMEVEGEVKSERVLLSQEKKVRKEVNDILVKDYAERKLDEVVREMLDKAATQLESQLKDEEISRIFNLLEFLQPKKDPKTGKMKKGMMNADAYRKVARITQMIEATQETKSAKMEAINSQLAGSNLDEKNSVEMDELEHDRLSLELMNWSAYGALADMNLDGVRAAGESLRELALSERNAWEIKLEDEKMKLKKVALDVVRAMGEADSTVMRTMSENDLKTRRLFGAMAENVMSFSQSMYAMSGIPGLRELANETLSAISNGHIALTHIERMVNDKLEEFMINELGLKKQNQRTDFEKELKKTRKTNIVREKVEIHSLDLTVEEAQRWVSMSKEERFGERERMKEEAESKGWTVENMVEEADIDLLKSALETALNPPPQKNGRKGRARKRVEVTREFLKKQKPIVASADQMLNAVMTYEQPHYVENARINGYTTEVVDALRKEIGSDALAYGYRMREILSESGVAEEFERREGVPFPSQENYWPGRFRDSARTKNMDALDAETGSGTRYGMLIQRVSHRAEVDLSLGASNVFLAGCAQQNNYLIMGQMTAKWRRLLSDKKFAGSLNQRIGNNRFRAIKQMVDLLDGAGVVEAVTQRSISSLLGMCQSAHAVSVLSLAVTTIAKQPSALMHAAAFKGTGKVIKQLIVDRVSRGRISFGETLKLPAFQARYRDNREFAELMRLGSDVKWTRMASLSRMGMNAIEKMDVWTNCLSMTALYNLTWKELEENNKGAAEQMAEEQMKGICEQTITNALELVGQPQRGTQKSMMAALGRENVFMKMSGYMGSEMLNKVGMSIAIGEKSRAEGDGYVKRFGKRLAWISTMSSAEQIILLLIDLMRGNAPDDDEWEEWLAYNAITGLSGLGLLNTLPILGPSLEEASGQLNKLITGNHKGFVKTGLLDDMLFNVRGWMRCAKKLSKKDVDYTSTESALIYADLIRLGAAGSGLTRGAHSTMSWASTLSGTLQSCSAAGNMVRPIIQREVNQEKKEKKARKDREKKW